MVQSSLWTPDASQLRQWLDDVEFGGGGSQPVALAEALLEAASLFELPSTLQPGGAVQSHCLVCMVSDPSTAPVAWPLPTLSGQVRSWGAGLLRVWRGRSG